MSFTMHDYSDRAGEVADGSAEAVRATSLYLDAAAEWLMLVPGKVKELALHFKQMPVEDRWLWFTVVMLLWAVIHYLMNREQVHADIRRLTFSLPGVFIGGVWWLLYNGIEKLA